MDMTGQPRLFALAIEAGQMQVLWDGHRGWSVRTQVRRQGDTWGSEPAAFYSELSTEELLEVICAEWAQLLGL